MYAAVAQLSQHGKAGTEQEPEKSRKRYVEQQVRRIGFGRRQGRGEKSDIRLIGLTFEIRLCKALGGFFIRLPRTLHFLGEDLQFPSFPVGLEYLRLLFFDGSAEIGFSLFENAGIVRNAVGTCLDLAVQFRAQLVHLCLGALVLRMVFGEYLSNSVEFG